MQTNIDYRGYYNHLRIQDRCATGQVRSGGECYRGDGRRGNRGDSGRKGGLSTGMPHSNAQRNREESMQHKQCRSFSRRQQYIAC